MALGRSDKNLAISVDTKRVNGERSFLLDFFEKFHEAHQ